MAATPSEVARRWFEEVWNQRKAETIDELFAPGAVAHLASGDVTGPAEIRKFQTAILTAFPDQRMYLDQIVAEGDNAVVHWRVEATHGGEMLGVKATGEKVKIVGMTRFVVRQGKIVEGWDCWDSGALKEKLNAAAGGLT